MDALILTAGSGSPRCLVEVGGRPLLSHQLAAAKATGALRVTIVTGHAPDRLRAAVGDRVEIVRNARHTETSSLYSFWLARHRVRGGVLGEDLAAVAAGGENLGLLHLTEDVTRPTGCSTARSIEGGRT